MSQKQQNITIAAPGFGGLNTEVSPTQQGEQFASIADNCIIDKYGRIGARKGLAVTTTDGSAYAGEQVEAIHEHLAEDGTKTVFTAANNKLFIGEQIPADITPGGATITDNHWQMITFNDDCYFLQYGHIPIRYTQSTGATAEFAAIPNGDCGMGAYGRLWVANIDGDQQTVYWSDLLIGNAFSTGSSGSLSVDEYWPRGHDTIQAIAAHNGFLLIFGKQSILVYSGADGDPATTLTLADHINGIGCVARDTVRSLGADIYFLDYSGVRSFARTIQEKSMPIGEVSKNVRTDILGYIATEGDLLEKVNAVYSPEESFYLVQFASSLSTICFSTKNLLEDGSARTTYWPSVTAVTATHATDRILIGGTAKVGNYDTYLDDAAQYTMRYYSNPFSFGSSANLKFPKQVDFTLISGAGGAITVFWSFDYSTIYRSKIINLTATGVPAQYNIDEWNNAEFTGGVKLDRIKANVGGSGVVVTIGIETAVNGLEFSIQEMNIQALLGRIV